MKHMKKGSSSSSESEGRGRMSRYSSEDEEPVTSKQRKVSRSRSASASSSDGKRYRSSSSSEERYPAKRPMVSSVRTSSAERSDDEGSAKGREARKRARDTSTSSRSSSSLERTESMPKQSRRRQSDDASPPRKVAEASDGKRMPRKHEEKTTHIKHRQPPKKGRSATSSSEQETVAASEPSKKKQAVTTTTTSSVPTKKNQRSESGDGKKKTAEGTSETKKRKERKPERKEVKKGDSKGDHESEHTPERHRDQHSKHKHDSKRHEKKSRGSARSSSSSSSEDKPKKTKKSRNQELRRLISDKKMSVREAIIKQNNDDMKLLHTFVEGGMNAKKFREKKSERLNGQWQFGTVSYNMRRADDSCKGECIYCYVKPVLGRWGKNLNKVDIEDAMPCDKKKIEKTWKKVKNPADRHMYFFPSTSDVFAENAADYVSVCRKMIDAGHEVLFVTKASMKATEAIVAEFNKIDEAYRKSIYVYVTITADDDAVTHHFEPNGSLFEERCRCIRYYVKNGFDVNVMMEPYLVDPVPLLKKIFDVLPETGTVAIGRMNYTAAIKLSEDAEEDKKLKEQLEKLYSGEKVLELYHAIEDNPRVFLKKETVMSVIKAVESANGDKKRASAKNPTTTTTTTNAKSDEKGTEKKQDVSSSVAKKDVEKKQDVSSSAAKKDAEKKQDASSSAAKKDVEKKQDASSSAAKNDAAKRDVSGKKDEQSKLADKKY